VNRCENGQVAIGALAILSLLGVVAAGVLLLGRAALAQARAGGAADATALAAARILLERGDDALPRRDPLTRRTLPPRITVAKLEAEAAAAARAAAEAHGARLGSVRFVRHGAGAVPVEADVAVERRHDGLPAWLGSARIRRLTGSRARAGVEAGYATAASGYTATAAGGPRAAELAGFDGAGAVVAAAEAQLGWPYVWGGESRAEGGFDCSGLVDFALAAAGYPVGRLTAAGLQDLAQPIPLASGALLPGDLVFVGRPAHHVGLVAGPGLAIEAPHTGAVVHLVPIAAGGWTGAGRIAPLAAAAAGSDVPAACRRTRPRCSGPPWPRPRCVRTCRPRSLPPSSTSRAASRPAPSHPQALEAPPSSWPPPGRGTGIRTEATAPSSPAGPCSPRRATCGCSSIAPPGTSRTPWPRTTPAGRGRRARGR
jgi:peptidoglycan DL-endopeptidase CwlO